MPSMKHIACTILVGCSASMQAAQAGTSTASFQVTATVPEACSVSADGALAFGNYTGSQVDATTGISVTCTSTTAYTVGLNDGLNFGATRRMKLGTSDYLGYEMYKEGARSNRWGNTGTELVSGTGSGAAQSLTIYGRMPAGGPLVPGSFADTISVTVSY